MNQKLISTRVALAALLVHVQALGRSRELSASITCLQAGRMLLGTVAQRLGATNPYPHADNAASKLISPSADVPESYTADVDSDPIVAVKTCRCHLQDAIDALERFRGEQWARPFAYGPGVITEALFDRAVTELVLAKQWLGEQLAVIAGHALVKPFRPEPVKVPEGTKSEGLVRVEETIKTDFGTVETSRVEGLFVGSESEGVSQGAQSPEEGTEPGSEVGTQRAEEGAAVKAMPTVEAVDEMIRQDLKAGATITSICRDLDVTEHRVKKIKRLMEAVADVAAGESVTDAMEARIDGPKGSELRADGSEQPVV